MVERVGEVSDGALPVAVTVGGVGLAGRQGHVVELGAELEEAGGQAQGQGEPGEQGDGRWAESQESRELRAWEPDGL